MVHGQAYYSGLKAEKNLADKALKICVSKTIGSERLGEETLGLILGELMEKAVWIGRV